MDQERLEKAATHYQVLLIKIAELREKADTYQRIATTSLIEETLHKQFNHEVSRIYQESADEIKAQIAELEKGLPCQAFMDMLGLHLHELYREKYPIGHRTTIRDCGQFWDSTYYYAVIAPLNVWETPEPSLVIDSRQIAVKMEPWSDTISLRMLGYDAELDMVFVGGRRGMRLEELESR